MTDITAHSRPGTAASSRWMVAAAVLLAAAIVLSWQSMANTERPTLAVAWGSVGFAAYAASLLCLIGGGKGKWLGLGRWWIGSWTLLWYGVAFGLATLTWLQPLTGPEAQISLSSVLRAQWLVAVGMTLWVFGYFAGPGRSATRLGKRAMAALNLRFAPEVRSPLAPVDPLRDRHRGQDRHCAHHRAVRLRRKQRRVRLHHGNRLPAMADSARSLRAVGRGRSRPAGIPGTEARRPGDLDRPVHG